MYNRIKDLPTDERPYEKFIKYGPKALSDAELIAIIIKTGTKECSSVDIARRILASTDNTNNILSICRKSYEDLKAIKGVGSVKAITIKCVAEICERISISNYPNNPIFNTPKVISDYYMERFRHISHEELCVVFLNSNNMLISDIVLTKGTVSQTLISARDIFIQALKYEAVNIVLIHNHPSGNPTPSNEDILVTNKLIEAGKLINIEVLDHIIIGDNKYLSFRECKLIE